MFEIGLNDRGEVVVSGRLDAAQAGRFEEAWRLLVADNPLPALHAVEAGVDHFRKGLSVVGRRSKRRHDLPLATIGIFDQQPHPCSRLVALDGLDQVLVSRDDLVVDLQWKRPDDAKAPVRPGDQLEVTLKTTDPQGQPVAAELRLPKPTTLRPSWAAHFDFPVRSSSTLPSTFTMPPWRRSQIMSQCSALLFVPPLSG